MKLIDAMGGSVGWGRDQGRAVFQQLVAYADTHANVAVIRISMRGVKRIDVSFASETIVELARRLRGRQGICLVDLDDVDIIENIDAAAARKEQPLTLWREQEGRIIGSGPSNGTRKALDYALCRREVRASQFADAEHMSIANASSKFKQLWQQGFLLRCEGIADTGGVEYLYRPIA